jgi:hypothetical protein
MKLGKLILSNELFVNTAIISQSDTISVEA